MSAQDTAARTAVTSGTPQQRRRTYRPTRVVSPDRSRSALWDGTDRVGNTLVFAGPDCAGAPLFACTLVYARTPKRAAEKAALLGLRAERESLGAGGATGAKASHLYYGDVQEAAGPR